MLQIALIQLEKRILYSCYSPKSQEPNSAVTQLIQGIYENDPNNAIFVLRNRIYTNYLPTLICKSMIAIAAKRISQKENMEFFLNSTSLPKIQITYSPQKIENQLSNLEFENGIKWLHGANDTQLNLNTNRQPLYNKNRSVRAFIVNPQKQIIMTSSNQNSINKTQHAEVLLLQNFFSLNQCGFNEPMTLFTSLQCCKMCAAMLWTMHSDPWNNLKVLYLNAEKGNSANNSILAKNSEQRRELTENINRRNIQFEFKFDF